MCSILAALCAPYIHCLVSVCARVCVCPHVCVSSHGQHGLPALHSCRPAVTTLSPWIDTHDYTFVAMWRCHCACVYVCVCVCVSSHADLDQWVTLVRREKAIYHTLNKMSMDTSRKVRVTHTHTHTHTHTLSLFVVRLGAILTQHVWVPFEPEQTQKHMLDQIRFYMYVPV